MLEKCKYTNIKYNKDFFPINNIYPRLTSADIKYISQLLRGCGVKTPFNCSRLKEGKTIDYVNFNKTLNATPLCVLNP